MRILQIITLSELGGAQSVVINLANMLSLEHEVIVAAGEGDGKMWGLLNGKVKQYQCKYLKRKISLLDICAAFELRRLYKKTKPDIIHLHSSKAGLLGRIALPSSKIVYTVHGFDSIRVAHRKFLPLEKLLQNRCGAIVGVSNYDERNLLAERITQKVSTVYNGIDVPLSLPKDPFKEFDDSRKKVLCIARLSAPKNHKLFIDVASKMPQYDFIWIGNQTIPDFNYPSNAYFLGSIPSAGSYIRYADLLMLPSNYEGLPMVIIEAMSLGKPIVASNVGGVSEIVRNGENGYALDNDSELFVQKIEYILQDQQLYDVFSKQSLKIYREELTIGKMMSEYLKVYNSVINKS